MTTVKQWAAYQAKARAILVAELERHGTQRALAKHLGGVSVPFVNMMLKGKRPVSSKVSKRLGLSPLPQPRVSPVAIAQAPRDGTWWAVIPKVGVSSPVTVWASRASAVAHRRQGERIRRVTIKWSTA